MGNVNPSRRGLWICEGMAITNSITFLGVDVGGAQPWAMAGV